MGKLPATAGEDLLEIVMRYERVSTMLTSNRPVLTREARFETARSLANRSPEPPN